MTALQTPPIDAIFDHVALAVDTWPTAYELLVGRHGGVWWRGGDAGEFLPGQFAYPGGFKIEVLAPGPGEGNFVTRFLDGFGPAPHHLTWYVDDMAAFQEAVAQADIPLLPGFIDVPGREERFIHPRSPFTGTLVQVIEPTDEIDGRTEAPNGLPEPSHPASIVEWVALSVASLDRALVLYRGILGGRSVDEGTSVQGRWHLLSWGVGRQLLLVEGRSTAETPTVIEHLKFTTSRSGKRSQPEEVIEELQQEQERAFGLMVYEE